LWWVWKPGGRLQTTLLALGATGIATTVLKQLLKWTAGRYWPETWKHDNPSLIGSGDYGFHPFHYGSAYESFPSGHATVLCALMIVLWVSYPRWRWLWALLGALVCVALVAMNYHFVSDVIAGAILGSITGLYIARLFRLADPRVDSRGRETERVPAARS
jgi:membrane-associated phospholipid phosphatase